MNRMAARNVHGTIPCGVPSPPRRVAESGVRTDDGQAVSRCSLPPSNTRLG